MCRSREESCEVGVHSMRALFEEPSSEGAILADAKNAFNLYNGQTNLLNIQMLCPSFAVPLTNT